MKKTKTLRPSKRRTLHWMVCFLRTGGLKFLISGKVWFSLGMPKLICIVPFHRIIWFRNPLSWRAFWLKFAALTRKRRKRLYDVETFTNKIVRMRLLAFGNHVTSRNRGFFSEQERKPWERGYFCETCRSDLSSILKVINFLLLLLHYKELQTCPFMATKAI